jgi:hypothetical protein
MSQKTLRREIQAETRVIDKDAGICEYVASDQTLDYSREIILARGWKFTNFANNSPFVDSHDYSSINKVLGKVLSWRVEGDKLIEKVQWAVGMGSPLCDWGWSLTCAGILKAVSVGFVPTKAVSRWDSDPTGYVQALQTLGLAGADDSKKPRYIYQEQEQIELSACILGCNPNALIRGYESGDLDEEQMVAAGYGSAENFDFLKQAAAVFDDVPAPARRIIQTAMARIFQDQQTPSKTAPDAIIPGDAKGAPNRRGMESFVSELRNLTTTS